MSKGVPITLKAMLLTILVLCVPQAMAAEQFALIVKTGAYILHPDENLVIKKRKTHGLLTFLPIGTLAVTSGRTKLIKNRKKEKKLFYEVFTDSGLTGLLRSDLFDRMKEGKWLVANTDQTIYIKHPRQERTRSNFSKTSGKFVGVTRKPTASDLHYLVSIHWAKHPDGRVDAGRIDSDFVTDGDAVYIDTLELEQFRNSTPKISPIVSLSDKTVHKAKSLLGKSFGWMRNKVKNMVGEGVMADVGKIDTYLQNVVVHQCGAQLDGSAALGADLKAVNFKIGTKLKFKEAGHEYFFRAFKPTGFSSDLGDQFVVFRDVKCDGSLRNRLDTLIIEGEKVSGMDMQLKYFPKKLKSNWDTNLQSTVFRAKMMRIKGPLQYQELSTYIHDQASDGTWLATLLGNEQKALIAQLIPMIASIQK